MENKSKIVYGKNLKDTRIESGLTQQQLADKLSIQRTEITMYENSFRFPSYQRHLKICEALELDYNSDFPYFDDDVTDFKQQLQQLQAENEELKVKLDKRTQALEELLEFESENYDINHCSNESECKDCGYKCRYFIIKNALGEG